MYLYLYLTVHAGPTLWCHKCLSSCTLMYTLYTYMSKAWNFVLWYVTLLNMKVLLHKLLDWPSALLVLQSVLCMVGLLPHETFHYSNGNCKCLAFLLKRFSHQPIVYLPHLSILVWFSSLICWVNTILILQVLIIGHIPPGDDDNLAEYGEVYLNMTRQFSDIIVGHLFGHTHMDQFQLVNLSKHNLIWEACEHLKAHHLWVAHRLMLIQIKEGGQV